MNDIVDMVPVGEKHLVVLATQEPVDVLNRQEIIDPILQLIETISSTRGTGTFSLNGAWGSGKTFALNMLEQDLAPL